MSGAAELRKRSAVNRKHLSSFRLKDREQPMDLIEIGLIGEKDLAALPPKLAARLKELLENPEG